MPPAREMMGNAPEKKERRPPRFTVETESIVSEKHPDRNEDAVMGDTRRIERELANPPKLETANFDADLDAIAAAAMVEKRLAADLKDRAVFGNSDGVSGKKGEGAGLMASRLGMARAAEVMARLPADADAETSKRALEAAILEAHKAVSAYKKDRADLSEMATTMDLARLIDNDDGTVELAYAHVGDSRIYAYRPAEKGADGKTIPARLERVTEDGSMAKLMYEGGQVTIEGRQMNIAPQLTKKQYDEVNAAENAKQLPDDLKKYFKMRNIVVDSVGAENCRVTSGTVKAKKGTKFFMMSDGIGDNLTDAKIEEIVKAGGGIKELAKASSDFAKTTDERAKMDDISGIEIATEQEGSGEYPAAGRQEQRPAASPEQIGQWRQEAKDAKAEIAVLEELQRMTEDASVDMRAGDADRIRQLGGAEGVQDRLRDMRSYALSRELPLLREQIADRQRNAGIEGPDLAAARDVQRQVTEWQDAVIAASRSASAKGERGVTGANVDAIRFVGEAMKRGEKPQDVAARAEQLKAEAEKKLIAIESIEDDSARLERMMEEWHALEGERRQAIQRKEARQMEDIRRSIQGTSADAGTGQARQERPSAPPPAPQKKSWWRRLTGG